MTSFKLALLAAAAVVCTAPAFCEEAGGKWTGLVHPAGNEEGRQIFVALETAAGGGMTGYLESPSQSPLHYPLTEIGADGKTLRFTSKMLQGVYQATWDDAKKSWVGEWRQHGKTFVLELARDAS